VNFHKVKEAQGTFAGTIKVSAKKDLVLDQIRLSFNQYIYSYLSTTGDRHRWKEYFVGTQTLDGLSLAAGESKEIPFQIQYEAEMRDDERERVEKKNATIKDLMKMSHFRKNGKGMGTEWSFQLVVVYVLPGGQEVKDAHVVQIG
jgi:hypothetical protein